MTIYFTRYVHTKSIKIINRHYDELMGKIGENEVEKYLMVNNYMLDKVLDKIIETIDIGKFDDTKILTDSIDKSSDYITLKLITCVIDAKFYRQIFSEKALYNKYAQ